MARAANYRWKVINECIMYELIMLLLLLLLLYGCAFTGILALFYAIVIM